MKERSLPAEGRANHPLQWPCYPRRIAMKHRLIDTNPDCHSYLYYFELNIVNKVGYLIVLSKISVICLEMVVVD